jgi:hypothetical protein
MSIFVDVAYALPNPYPAAVMLPRSRATIDENQEKRAGAPFPRAPTRGALKRYGLGGIQAFANELLPSV